MITFHECESLDLEEITFLNKYNFNSCNSIFQARYRWNFAYYHTRVRSINKLMGRTRVISVRRHNEHNSKRERVPPFRMTSLSARIKGPSRLTSWKWNNLYQTEKIHSYDLNNPPPLPSFSQLVKVKIVLLDSVQLDGGVVSPLSTLLNPTVSSSVHWMRPYCRLVTMTVSFPLCLLVSRPIIANEMIVPLTFGCPLSENRRDEISFKETT